MSGSHFFIFSNNNFSSFEFTKINFHHLYNINLIFFLNKFVKLQILFYEKYDKYIDRPFSLNESDIDDTRAEVDISVDEDAKVDAMAREEELTQQKGEKAAYKFLVKFLKLFPKLLKYRKVY